jgi:FkbM family methyltransferase
MSFITKFLKNQQLLKDLCKKKALISYSQQGEDLAIQRYFGDKSDGFYIDIGAFHPIQYSNTYLFYQKGWNGINIEPNPDSFQKFQTIRKRDINLNIGINEKNEKLTYYKFNAPALNTFDKAHADLWAGRPGFKIEETITVDTFTLSDVLSKYVPANKPIDFMSVDVEGLDFKVLSSNNWDKFRPKLLLVEESITDKNIYTESQILSFLSGIGYRLWSVSGGTIVYHDTKHSN